MSLQRNKQNKKAFSLTDIIILGLAACLVGSLSVWQWQEPQTASTAIVHSNHNDVMRLELNDARTHNVMGKLGNSQLEVSGGKIRFSRSPCKRRVCIHTGWLKESGEAAACLPNGISVVLHSDVPRYDSINF